jgi:GcrA cell cycle regulator
VNARKRPWSESDIEQLKTLVASGASALRASVALKRSLAVTKNKARELGTPFQLEVDLRAKRRMIFQDFTDGQCSSRGGRFDEDR